MSLKAQAIRNVGATWLGLLIHAAVGFFLSPFILHRLGDEAFSVWVLVFAISGYFGLLDLGIRSAIVKYTAKFIATDDVEQLSRYLSTSLAFYAVVALVVLLVTIVGSFYLHLLFKIPAGMLLPTRILLLLTGSTVALSFPLGVFAGVLEGLQKFTWLQLSQIGITLLRAILIVIVMTNGGGLLAIGTITVAMNLLGYLIFTGMALHALPVRLSLDRVEKPAFRNMASYGVFAFAILAAEKLRFQSDAMVIGAFLSATAITLFSVASKLVEYSSYAVRSMSQIVTPMSSQFQASGDLGRLRRTFLAGNRACAFIIFPLCITMVILGKSIIESWVGSRYTAAYPVLVLLIVPRAFYLAQSTSTKILLGMGRHRMLATILLLEGGMNLLLSLLLVRPFGIVGVALGTAIPLICTSVVFLPRHLCSLLEIPLIHFLKSAYWLPFSLCFPLTAVLWLLARTFPAHSGRGVLLQVTCGMVTYVAACGITLFQDGIHVPRTWHAFSQFFEPR
jgi:O-antigen/teichoic acid export membrane protein